MPDQQKKKATAKRRRAHPKGVRRHRPGMKRSCVGMVGDAHQARWYPSAAAAKVAKVLSAYDEPETP